MKRLNRFLCAAAAVALLAFSAGCNSTETVYAEYVVSKDAPFTTNTKADKQGKTSLVRIAIVLTLDSDTEATAMETKEAQIRDTILFILRDYTAEEYKDPAIDQTLRTRIVDTLNERLETKHITGVLITDFVVQ